MLLRLILTVCMMIGVFMPCAYAEEKADILAWISRPHLLGQQPEYESPLSKISIDSEDWIDGNTYYIRYTFTNPTDTVIEKDIQSVTVQLSAYWGKTYTKISKAAVLPEHHLSIPPHSKTNLLITLPKEYTHQQYTLDATYIRFTENDMLSLDTWTIAADVPDITDTAHRSPVSFQINNELPTDKPYIADLSLVVTNRTAHTLRTIQDVQTNSLLPYSVLFGRKDPSNINIPPYSKKTITIPDFFAFYPDRLTSRVLSLYQITAFIDGMKYKKSPYTGIMTADKYLAIYSKPIPLQLPTLTTQKKDKQILDYAYYFIKDHKVHCFFRLHNHYAKPYYLSSFSLNWHYQTPFTTLKQVRQISHYYKNQPMLLPNETRYYTVTFDLPADYSFSYNNLLSQIKCSFRNKHDFYDKFIYNFKLTPQDFSPLRRSYYSPMPLGDDYYDESFPSI